MFITESMRILLSSAALLMASAVGSSGVVGACTTSKPASRTILKRSAGLRFFATMSSTNPFFIADREAGGFDTVAWFLLTASGNSAEPLTPKLNRPAVVNDELMNSRRDRERMLDTSHDSEQTQRNLLRSIFGSHTSLDFSV